MVRCNVLILNTVCVPLSADENGVTFAGRLEHKLSQERVYVHTRVISWGHAGKMT